MIDPHKHCPVCQTPIPLTETTCSDKCQKELDERKGKVNRGKMIVNVIMIIVLIIAILMVASRFFNFF